MKGVVLAGGFGTRLAPMTRVVNKHLLDVYDQPMVYYPIQTLARAGVTEVSLVTLEAEVDQFRALLGDGSELGVSLTFVCQEGAGGIAEALGLVRDKVDGPLVAILGDNLFQDDLRPYVDAFRTQGGGARILLKQVEDARRFGVATVDGATGSPVLLSASWTSPSRASPRDQITCMISSSRPVSVFEGFLAIAVRSPRTSGRNHTASQS